MKFLLIPLLGLTIWATTFYIIAGDAMERCTASFETCYHTLNR